MFYQNHLRPAFMSRKKIRCLACALSNFKNLSEARKREYEEFNNSVKYVYNSRYVKMKLENTVYITETVYKVQHLSKQEIIQFMFLDV